MNEKTKLVFAGWLSLDSNEKNELDIVIRDYLGQSSQKQKEIEGLYIHAGPIGQPCPCCGK